MYVTACGARTCRPANWWATKRTVSAPLPT
jgi:hypothetical protein